MKLHWLIYIFLEYFFRDLKVYFASLTFSQEDFSMKLENAKHDNKKRGKTTLPIVINEHWTFCTNVLTDLKSSFSRSSCEAGKLKNLIMLIWKVAGNIRNIRESLIDKVYATLIHIHVDKTASLITNGRFVNWILIRLSFFELEKFFYVFLCFMKTLKRSRHLTVIKDLDVFKNESIEFGDSFYDRTFLPFCLDCLLWLFPQQRFDHVFKSWKNNEQKYCFLLS